MSQNESVLLLFLTNYFRAKFKRNLIFSNFEFFMYSQIQSRAKYFFILYLFIKYFAMLL